MINLSQWINTFLVYHKRSPTKHKFASKTDCPIISSISSIRLDATARISAQLCKGGQKVLRGHLFQQRNINVHFLYLKFSSLPRETHALIINLHFNCRSVLAEYSGAKKSALPLWALRISRQAFRMKTASKKL